MTLPSCTPAQGLSLAAAFNEDCRCLIVDDPALTSSLANALPKEDFSIAAQSSNSMLFSATAVFLAREDVANLRATINAIERVIELQLFQSTALVWADALARIDLGNYGACMGYDFHLDHEGPHLIEINTNAGGLLLNAALARAARACCSEAQKMDVGSSNLSKFDESVVEMFRNEWRSHRPLSELRTIAIVDDQPQSQYLSVEFRLFAELFKRHGLQAVIADAATLARRESRLYFGDVPIDLVYNRLTDFALTEPRHACLRDAFVDGVAVVTPNPRNYALYADKRNLTLLTNRAFLNSLGLPATTMDTLVSRIPQTMLVTPETAPKFWVERRRWFFKPVTGFGSRAAYRGDKVTKRVFEEIAAGGYVAQARVEPAKRANPQPGSDPLKYDIRCYVYRGEIQLIAARLYQGQTTNFRTVGGGFAPVFYAVS